MNSTICFSFSSTHGKKGVIQSKPNEKKALGNGCFEIFNRIKEIL
jgi:hypothetical protein